MSKIFKTIAKDSRIEIQQKRSLFIGEVLAVTTEAEARDALTSIKSREAGATHHVHAFAVGVPGTNLYTNRFSDDGEPKGTAGKPILDVILGRNLTNVIVVVTRYFGGILLGTGGLVRAYGQAASTALDEAGEQLLIEKFIAKLSIAYSLADILRHYIQQKNIVVVAETFDVATNFVLALTTDERLELAKFLADLTSGTVDLEILGKEYMR